MEANIENVCILKRNRCSVSDARLPLRKYVSLYSSHYAMTLPSM
jgi:hypothetical protein